MLTDKRREDKFTINATLLAEVALFALLSIPQRNNAGKIATILFSDCTM